MKNITLITAKAGLSFELVPKPVHAADLGPQIVVHDGDFRIASYCLSTFRENVAKKQGVCVTAGKFEKYRAIESDTLAELVVEADALLSGTPPPPTSQGTPTPGPWSADKWAPGYTVSAPDAHYSVCHLEGCNNAESNARLIAASPCLLAALERLANAVDAHCRAITTAALIELDDATINARAAIAIATGGAK
ncbi:hypothetical protein LBMAG57_36140 [Verrucomicrobiota bacterium]|nr:hypothetical protein LBMAG57_36140 [Verrucomicrobiota bacterium]